MEIDAGYVASSALRFMEHLPEREVAACFARLSASSRSAPVDLSGPATLFDQPKVESGA
jgi:site-specific DNA-methyltransferase (cytosine-N4-specific)